MKKLDKTSKVGFVIHTYGPIDHSIYFSHMGCMLSFSHKFNMAFLGIDKQRAADARNILVKSAKSLNCTHMLIIDADHIIPTHMLDALSNNDEALIASGLVTKRKSPYNQVGFVKKDNHYHPVALPVDGRSYLVDVPAMGCTLIDMDVFDIVKEPYFTDSVAITEDGKSYNKRSDIRFFEKCGDAGIKMVIDTRVLIGHMRDPEPIYPNCVPDTASMNKVQKIRNNERSLQYQNEVYEKAKLLAIEHNMSKVLDLGCGNPIKLIKKLGFVDQIVGIDFQDKILDIAYKSNETSCRATKKWIGHDLDEECNLNMKYNLVISADVIEHLQDPDTLLQTAKTHMDDNAIFILSSPEKTTTNEDNHLHVQEFTKEELLGILVANGFSVTDCFSYQETSNIPYTNNVFVCKLNKENKNGNSDPS